jgi:hypothetical protein
MKDQSHCYNHFDGKRDEIEAVTWFACVHNKNELIKSISNILCLVGKRRVKS